jgi:F0F1-type ATP synthase membrane subunit b/b'
MEIWQLLVALALLAAATVAVVWFVLARENTSQSKQNDKLLTDLAERDVEQIFDKEFREELRNRGWLHFEKIINENAMFLQQDLRLTTSQLNEYMKEEIKRVLKEEFSKYEESISGARDMALQAIQKTRETIEQQREALEKQMAQEAETEKTRRIERFEKNMADVINHYILAAIGDEIDINDQLDFILQSLEDNKEAIVEDIKGGN